MTDLQTWEIYAIRYATNPRRVRGQNFILDPHPDQPMTIDFFSWALIAGDQVIVIDTGMSPEMASKKGHDFLVSPVDMLRQIGVTPETVGTVIMTHLHFDHTGHISAFPAARFLLQAEEMAYVTGPEMETAFFRHAYEVDEIAQFLHLLHQGRLHLHGRDLDIADGVSVHWVGGHCAGQEVVRVRTERGWVVLTSDALHYYEEIERRVPFAVVHSIQDMLAAHDRIRDLAESDDHIVPAHDPRVMDLYPGANPGLAGKVVRLDLPPGPDRPD